MCPSRTRNPHTMAVALPGTATLIDLARDRRTSMYRNTMRGYPCVTPLWSSWCVRVPPAGGRWVVHHENNSSARILPPTASGASPSIALWGGRSRWIHDWHLWVWYPWSPLLHPLHSPPPPPAPLAWRDHTPRPLSTWPSPPYCQIMTPRPPLPPLSPLVFSPVSSCSI